jgi:hypothetical protein
VTPAQDAAWRRLWDRLLAEPQNNDKPVDVVPHGRKIASQKVPTRQNRTDDGIS